jgi:tetratricopeptide (TPR) repeat protein
VRQFLLSGHLEAIQNTLGRTEQFIEENQKSVSIIIGAIIFIIVGYFAYQNFYVKPLEEEAQQQIFMAQNYFAQDSFKLALNGDSFNDGFLDVADNYGMTNTGSLANYYAGISYLHLGQYDDAIEYLKKFDAGDELVTTMAIGAIGDAYVEKDEFDEAISYYKKATERKTNDFITPVFLIKLGLTYEKLGNKEDALSAYEKIKTEYVKSNEARKIDKYIERVKL